ncbi:MAG: pilus assembly protein TadG-related protein, partial [Anaerolineales bacterium]
MRTRHEAGQTYIIFAMLIIGLLSFSALAIDGGAIYHEHRRSQNATDAAALAAAYAKIKGQPLGTAALANATTNDYVTTAQHCTPAGPDCILGVGPDLTVQVTNPPRTGIYAGDPEYIHVIINNTVDTNFLHILFSGGGFPNQAEATSRVWPTQNYRPGYAIYALAEHDCKAIWFTGTGDTNVVGGGVFSNSDADTTSCESGVQDGGGAIAVSPPPHGIEVVGTFDSGGSGSVSPSPVEYADRTRIRPMPEPTCAGLPDYGQMKINSAGNHTINPGSYSEITVLANANLLMNPGMYCVYGNKGFTANGGSITGSGLMIYMQDGPFDLGGNTLVQLSAELNTGTLIDAADNDWKGMLLYMDPSNSSDVEI